VRKRFSQRHNLTASATRADGYPMYYPQMPFGGPGAPMMMPYMVPPSYNPGTDEIKKLSDEVMQIKLVCGILLFSACFSVHMLTGKCVCMCVFLV
jgi:hypothetical protein